MLSKNRLVIALLSLMIASPAFAQIAPNAQEPVVAPVSQEQAPPLDRPAPAAPTGVQIQAPAARPGAGKRIHKRAHAPKHARQHKRVLKRAQRHQRAAKPPVQHEPIDESKGYLELDRAK